MRQIRGRGFATTVDLGDGNVRYGTRLCGVRHQETHCPQLPGPGLEIHRSLAESAVQRKTPVSGGVVRRARTSCPPYSSTPAIRLTAPEVSRVEKRALRHQRTHHPIPRGSLWETL